MKYETFQQKLDRFKREPIGFLVKSKEIADELAKVFEREGMKSRQDEGPRVLMHRVITENKCYSGTPFVSYNYHKGEHRLAFGVAERTGRNLDELLNITLEELKSYNAPHTLEDKLALFKAGTHVLHTPTKEIYDKLMVELEKRGYVWHNGKSMTKYSFTDAGHGRKDLCIQWNGFGNERVSCGYIKYRKQDGLEVITLTPEDFSTTEVITITSDGYHRVTAESNGVTAEALCNPTDTFSIHKGSHMALKRLLEKLEGKTEATEGFHVGDIVEVVKHGYYFPNDITGIQGVITKKYERACDVKFPVEICNEKTWAFCNSGLKLVRKYNA